MTRQFSTMVSSGMSMLRALYVLEEQQENEKLKEAFSQVRKDVEAGLALSDALARHPDIFNELYVAMVAAGETGGILEETLHRVADQLEKDDSLRRQVKSAMVYPIVIFSSRARVIALVAFLVPVFERSSRTSAASCPRSRRSRSALAPGHAAAGTSSSAVVVGLVWRFRRWKNSERGREQWDRFKLQVPVQDRRHRPEGRAGALLAHVLGADRGRRADARGDRDHRPHRPATWSSRTRWTTSTSRSSNGGTIAAPMRNEPDAFPGMVVQMVAVGEETGALARCSRRSPTSTRTRSRRPSRP